MGCHRWRKFEIDETEKHIRLWTTPGIREFDSKGLRKNSFNIGMSDYGAH
jgi:hypothetical protein